MSVEPKELQVRPLRNGDHMSQKEFHRNYELMPEGYWAELLNGMVIVREPVSAPHSDAHMLLGSLFMAYKASTPGVQCGDNASVILGPKDEVQPDLLLRILPGCGGQTSDHDRYIKGAPELVAEISYSSRSIDLHLKKDRYKRAGVLEYIVVRLIPFDLLWFNLQQNRLVKPIDAILRSEVFPGLWISPDALACDDYHTSIDLLNKGIRCAEHEAFAAKLDNRKR